MYPEGGATGAPPPLNFNRLRDSKRDWDRDLNYVRLHGLQTPFQSRSGTAHCEWYFAPTTQSARADWPMRLCMASARIFKMHTHESRSETALRLHGLESGFLGESRSKTPFFRVSKRVSKAWFETALRLHGLKSGFQIRKRPNHVLKRLSERDSSPCKHTLCVSRGGAIGARPT